MAISTQDYGYSSSNLDTKEQVVKNSEFESYLQEIQKTNNSNDNIFSIEESNETDSIKIKRVAGIDENGNFIYFPKEIENQLDELGNKFIETGDAKYKFMQTEIAMQYNAYQNGEEIDSMFVVGSDGKFNWSDGTNSSSTNSKELDTEEFVNKMIEIFTQKLGRAKNDDLKERYQDLVDNYTQMKEDIEETRTNLYKNSSFYA